MMITWLKNWAAQAASDSERRQRFALIEAAYLRQHPLAYRSESRRLARANRPRDPLLGGQTP